VREFRQTWRGTRTREGKEVTRSGGRTGSLSISRFEFPRPDALTFAELLIDCEEDRTLREVLVGMFLEYFEVSAHTELQERG
jgi:hypothetical protein